MSFLIELIAATKIPPLRSLSLWLFGLQRNQFPIILGKGRLLQIADRVHIGKASFPEENPIRSGKGVAERSAYVCAGQPLDFGPIQCIDRHFRRLFGGTSGNIQPLVIQGAILLRVNRNVGVLCARVGSQMDGIQCTIRIITMQLIPRPRQVIPGKIAIFQQKKSQSLKRCP